MTASGTFTYVEHGFRRQDGTVQAVPDGPRAEQTARAFAETLGTDYVRRVVTFTRAPWKTPA